MWSVLGVALGNAMVAGGLALVAAAVGRWGRNPLLTHAVWLLVLIKLVTPPLVRTPLGWSSARHESASRAVSPPVERRDVVTADTTAVSLPPGIAEPQSPAADSWVGIAAAAPVETQAPVIAGPPATALPPATVKSEAKPSAQSPEARGLSARTLAWAVLLAWLTGSIWCATVVLQRMLNFRRLLRYGAPAPQPVLEEVSGLASQLSLRCPACTFMPGEICPMIYGLFGRNRLVIPASLWSTLTPPQQSSLLAHELAHVRRGDHLVRGLEIVTTILYWWHPAMWWARRELREVEEQCCDAWVARLLPGSGSAYAAALLKTVEFISPLVPAERVRVRSRQPATPAWASGMGEFQRLKRRLMMIRTSSLASTKMSKAAWIATLALAGLALPVSPGRAQSAAPVAAPATPAASDSKPAPVAADATPAPEATVPPPPTGVTPPAAPTPAPAGPASLPPPPTAPAALEELPTPAALGPGSAPVPLPGGAGLPGAPLAPVPPNTTPGLPAAAYLPGDDLRVQLESARRDVRRLSDELQSAHKRLHDLELAISKGPGALPGNGAPFATPTLPPLIGAQPTSSSGFFRRGMNGATPQAMPKPAAGTASGGPMIGATPVDPFGRGASENRVGAAGEAHDTELRKRLEDLDRQLAILSKQVSELRGSMQPGSDAVDATPSVPSPGR